MGKENAKMIIRTMTAEDIIAVRNMEQGLFAEDWSEHIWQQELSNEISNYLLLEEAGTVLAFAGYWLVAGEAQVTRVATSKEHQRRGLGAQLMSALVERAHQQQAFVVSLEVRESNRAARELYRKLGFREQGIRPNYYRTTHENAVLMDLVVE